MLWIVICKDIFNIITFSQFFKKKKHVFIGFVANAIRLIFFVGFLHLVKNGCLILFFLSYINVLKTLKKLDVPYFFIRKVFHFCKV